MWNINNIISVRVIVYRLRRYSSGLNTFYLFRRINIVLSHGVCTAGLPHNESLSLVYEVGK